MVATLVCYVHPASLEEGGVFRCLLVPCTGEKLRLTLLVDICILNPLTCGPGSRTI